MGTTDIKDVEMVENAIPKDLDRGGTTGLPPDLDGVTFQKLTDQPLPEIDRVAEKKLLRKLDIHIVPFAMLLYITSYLDRINIGNARLYSLQEDLHMSSSQYQAAVSVFFATYVIFEIPSNLVLKKFTPSRFLAGLTVSWGIVATLTGICQTFGGLIACRLILGVVEAGLFPGLILYFTMFYTKEEIALRVGYLACCTAIAGACGGMLAVAIGNLDGAAGLHGWRWILIIEGLPTFVLGFVIYFVLPNEFETAYFLTEEDKQLMRLRWAHQVGHSTEGEQLHFPDVKKGFQDWKIWLFSTGQFACDVALYSYATFLPTIISGIGAFSTITQVQALTIPCYALGGITFLIVAGFSDRQQLRGLYCSIMSLVAMVGYCLLTANLSPGAHYAGCMIVGFGIFISNCLPLAWLPTNYPRYGKRAVGNGIQVTIGNLGGLISPFIYPSSQGPRYVMGQAICIGMLLYCAVLYGGMSVYYHKRNKRRVQGLEDHKMEGLSPHQISELGDDSPLFMYVR